MFSQSGNLNPASSENEFEKNISQSEVEALFATDDLLLNRLLNSNEENSSIELPQTIDQLLQYNEINNSNKTNSDNANNSVQMILIEHYKIIENIIQNLQSPSKTLKISLNQLNYFYSHNQEFFDFYYGKSPENNLDPLSAWRPKNNIECFRRFQILAFIPKTEIYIFRALADNVFLINSISATSQDLMIDLMKDLLLNIKFTDLNLKLLRNLFDLLNLQNLKLVASFSSIRKAWKTHIAKIYVTRLNSSNKRKIEDEKSGNVTQSQAENTSLTNNTMFSQSAGDSNFERKKLFNLKLFTGDWLELPKIWESDNFSSYYCGVSGLSTSDCSIEKIKNNFSNLLTFYYRCPNDILLNMLNFFAVSNPGLVRAYFGMVAPGFESIASQSDEQVNDRRFKLVISKLTLIQDLITQADLARNYTENAGVENIQAEYFLEHSSLPQQNPDFYNNNNNNNNNENNVELTDEVKLARSFLNEYTKKIHSKSPVGNSFDHITQSVNEALQPIPRSSSSSPSLFSQSRIPSLTENRSSLIFTQVILLNDKNAELKELITQLHDQLPRYIGFTNDISNIKFYVIPLEIKMLLNNLCRWDKRPIWWKQTPYHLDSNVIQIDYSLYLKWFNEVLTPCYKHFNPGSLPPIQRP